MATWKSQTAFERPSQNALRGPRHVEMGRGASVVVGAREWGHAGHVGDLGASEGQPDVWWGRTRVWVGPVTWGVVEARHWGSRGRGRGRMCCAACPRGEGVLGARRWSREHGGGAGTCVVRSTIILNELIVQSSKSYFS